MSNEKNSNDHSVDSQNSAEKGDGNVSASTVTSANATSPAASAPATKSNGLSIFAILLSLGALGGSGFTWYQTQVLQVQNESKLSTGVVEIGGQISRLGDTVSRLQQDQRGVVSRADLDNTVLKLSASIKDQVGDLAAQQVLLKDSQIALADSIKKGVDEYTIEEVSQLLRLANNSILFSADLESAQNALALAAGQLQGLNNPAYGQVQGLISQEIAALESVQTVDITAIAASLAVVAKQVPLLPLANEPEVQAGQSQLLINAEQGKDLTFTGQLREMWQDMLSSVSIQKVDQPPKALLAPQQRYFLNQNILLCLSKAELALMQNEQEIYARNVSDAGAWLKDYFDLADEQVGKVISQLETLGGKSLAVDIPNISASYQALQAVVGGQ